MLAENLHIQQIKRFHKIMKDLDQKIENCTDTDLELQLSRKYYDMCQLWIKIDNFIEGDIKQELDEIGLD